MVNCSILGCKSRSEKKEEGISFHRFPSDTKKQNEWLKNVNLIGWTPTENDRICSLHFEEKFFCRSSSKVRLLNQATPTIFPSYPFYLQPKEVHKRSRSVRSRSGSPDPNKPGTSRIIQEIAPDSPRTKKLKIKLYHSKSLSHEKSRKIRVLNQSLKRYKKKVASLKVMLHVLKNKNLITAENYSLLENLTEFNRQLLSRKNKKNVKYSPELRKFAITLNFLSPKAYDYVRKVFDTCLPHASTIGKWYQNINADPGFTTESFRTLQNKVAISQKTLFCSLIIDEMSIRRHLEWDGKKYHGYVNFGLDLDHDTNSLAKDAFVLMLVCVNGTWKIPVGYFLTDSLNGLQKSQLVSKCIRLIEETGVKIVSLTFDAASSNIIMSNLLGCSSALNNLKTYFTYSNQKIYIFYDPCHMVKLVRNAFGERKCLIDADGRLINWKYIEMLEELQRNEGLHLGNKLRSSHIHFFKQKMKVRLAVQLLSSSVADALEFCANQLKLTQFQGCEGTIKFIRIMNRIFDILNSRSIAVPGWKKALCQQNIERVTAFIDDAVNYISGLKFSDKLVVSSNRKTGFIGLIICLKSTLGLYHDIVEQNFLKYFPIYKTSQDHLELFFSSIRSRGGWNNNPTARQFLGAYKRLLIRSEIREGGIGNCIPLEQILILASSSKSVYSLEEHINFSSPNAKLRFHSQEENIEDIFGDHDYIMNTHVILSECSYEIVVYIAGFVVKSIMTRIKCETCISSLIGHKENFLNSLITQKSRGGLIYPSDDVIKICKKCEIFLRIKNNDENNGKNSSLLYITNEVVSYFIDSNLFKHLSSPVLENDCNHEFYLIKAIAMKYLNIRLHFIAQKKSEKVDPIRNHLTKIILFKGQ